MRSNSTSTARPTTWPPAPRVSRHHSSRATLSPGRSSTRADRPLPAPPSAAGSRIEVRDVERGCSTRVALRNEGDPPRSRGVISVNAHRLRSLVVVLVLQAALPGAEALALVARGAEPIEVREGRVTALIVESPLVTLLQAIARQGGIDIVLHASLEGTVSVTFRDVPLEEALRRILRTTNAVFIYSQRSAAHVGAPPARAGVPQARLSEVHIYPGSTSVAASAPVVVRDAEPTTAAMTTRSRLTAEATKDLLGNR